MDTIARLRQLRDDEGLSYRELADQTGLSYTTLYGLLSVGFKPKRRTRLRLERFFTKHPEKGTPP